MTEPYNTGGNPGHPGPQGQPFNRQQGQQEVPAPGEPGSPGYVAPGMGVDNPGTGTLPPEQQGNVNEAQPQGLSADSQYGEPTGSPLIPPNVPEEEEEEEEEEQ